MITSFVMRSLMIVLTMAGAASLASANVVVVNLDTSVGGPIPESAPYARATFTLNPDNTIGVEVTAGSGLLITWFYFNKPAGTTSTNITPNPVYIGTKITSGFDDGNGGACLGVACFADYLTDQFGGEHAPFGTSDLSFTLSRAGGFTSLSDLINTSIPGCCSTPPFAADNTFGVNLTDDRSNAQKYTAIGTAAVPEPSSILLVFSAVGMFVRLLTRSVPGGRPSCTRK
jgi:hypothetical protein